ncbi:lysophospholipid acyltransferase family protein [Mesorhizobium sp. 10J20-29]|jgi:lysophospholipid acyltransferase (LPLAT)-like uncharacterized protein
MDERLAAQLAQRMAARRKPQRGAKALWVRIRGPLAQSRLAKGILTSLFAQAMRVIRITNPPVKESAELTSADGDYEPCIIALWHGQHLLAPAIYPSKRKLVAMVSRSADAEMNAKVIEKFGIRAVRGSGGRNGGRHQDKGGAQALIALKKALEDGSNVAMIADIPNGKPRDAGMGIILLAKLSGRPIIAGAIATSRRKVLDRTWDKTTISLPFGRRAVAVSPIIHVDKDASETEMESKRQELTAALNLATDRAYALVDGVR